MNKASCLEKETQYLWTMMRKLSAAADDDNLDAVDEFKEAIELVSMQSDYETVRNAAALALHFILVVRPANRLPVFGPMVAAAAGD